MLCTGTLASKVSGFHHSQATKASAMSTTKGLCKGTFQLWIHGDLISKWGLDNLLRKPVFWNIKARTIKIWRCDTGASLRNRIGFKSSSLYLFSEQKGFKKYIITKKSNSSLLALQGSKSNNSLLCLCLSWSLIDKKRTLMINQPMHSSRTRNRCYCHFIDEETEAPRDPNSCLRSHSVFLFF